MYLMYGMRCSHVWDHPTMHPLGAIGLPSWQLRTMRCSVDYVRPYVACMYLMYEMRCSHVWDVTIPRCTPWVQQSCRRGSLGRCDVVSTTFVHMWPACTSCMCTSCAATCGIIPRCTPWVQPSCRCSSLGRCDVVSTTFVHMWLACTSCTE